MGSSDQRAHERTPFQVRIRLTTREGLELEATTWNISEGGAFIELNAEQKQLLSIGSLVTTQVQGLPIPAPEVKMRVVRHSPGGVGLRIVE
ncbi:MAG: PilZ domain-containing protein [Saccharospirillum sp.]